MRQNRELPESPNLLIASVSFPDKAVIGERMKRAFQSIPPTRGNRPKIGIVVSDAMFVRRLEDIALDDLEIEGQTDRQVGLERGIEADHQELHGIFHAHRAIVPADDDRTAILGLADLEKRSIVARLDEIAFGIDHEQARLHPGNLSGDDDRSGEAPLSPVSVGVLALSYDRPQQLANLGGHLKHGG